MNLSQSFFSKHRTAIIIILVVVVAILLALLVGWYFEKRVEKLKKEPVRIIVISHLEKNHNVYIF